MSIEEKEKAPIQDFVFLNIFSEITGISKGQLNWIIFQRKNNGAYFFIRRLGNKRWMASPTLFYQWLEEGGTGS